VKQAEEFCRYSEEHQEDELAQIKASREQPMTHGDRGVRDEKPDEPNLETTATKRGFATVASAGMRGIRFGLSGAEPS
jgi:ribosomal protein L44E